MSTLPPGWPKPNYVNPPDRAHQSIAYNVILMVTVVVAVAMRYYSRLCVLKQRLGWDDFWITLSLFCTLALSISTTISNGAYGFSRHIWDIPLSWWPSNIICDFIAKIAFALAATFTRISVLCFYKRLVINSGIRWFKWVLIICHIFVAALCISLVLPMIFGCRPVSASFSIHRPENAVCINQGTVMFAGGIVNTVADFVVTVVPIPLIMRLRMPKPERIGVIVLLSLGFFITLAGIIRTYYIWLALVHTKDASWYSYPLFVAATVEVDVGILCACAPTLRPLLAPFFRGLNHTIRTHTHSDSHSFSRGAHRTNSMSLSATQSRINKLASTDLSKQHIITSSHSLHSLSTTRATPTPTSNLEAVYPFSPLSPQSDHSKSKPEESDLLTLTKSRSRASIPRSDASTLVPSSMTSPTASVYYSRQKGSYERQRDGAGSNYGYGHSHNHDDISVIKEVQAEFGTGSRSVSDASSSSRTSTTVSGSPSINTNKTFVRPQDAAATTIERPRTPHERREMMRKLSGGVVPRSAEPRPAPSIRTTPLPTTSTPRFSFPIAHQRSNRTSTQSQPPPAFSPYRPNITHAQVAEAAGYASPNLESNDRFDADVERGAESGAAIGIARSPFLDLDEEGEEDEEGQEYEGDAKYIGQAVGVPLGRGMGRNRDREQLDVLEMLKEEGRIRRGEIM